MCSGQRCRETEKRGPVPGRGVPTVERALIAESDSRAQDSRCARWVALGSPRHCGPGVLRNEGFRLSKSPSVQCVARGHAELWRGGWSGPLGGGQGTACHGGGKVWQVRAVSTWSRAWPEAGVGVSLPLPCLGLLGGSGPFRPLAAEEGWAHCRGTQCHQGDPGPTGGPGLPLFLHLKLGGGGRRGKGEERARHSPSG